MRTFKVGDIVKHFGVTQARVIRLEENGDLLLSSFNWSGPVWSRPAVSCRLVR